MGENKKTINYHLPQILLVVILLAASIYIALAPESSLMNWYNNDDGFFYYKAAHQIVAGKGVTFDGINPTNGFHPLWMVICVGVYSIFKTSLILPLRVIVILFGLMQAGSALLIYDTIKHKTGRWISFLLTFGFFTSWFVFSNTFSGGLESGLSCLMMIWLWATAIRYKSAGDLSGKQLAILGVIAGVTVLSRLDNIILVGFLGLWLVLDQFKALFALTADLTIAILVVVVSTITRAGYGINLLNLEILAITGLLIISSTLLLYLAGFYHNSPLLWKGRPPFIQGAAIWLISSLVVWLGVAALYQVGILEVYSRSILGLVSIAWFVYIVLIRGWVFSKRSDQSIIAMDLYTVWSTVLKWIRKPVAYYLPVAIILSGFFLWSQINFHTLMPVSGQIKQWWGTLGQTTYGSPIHTAPGLREYLLSEDSPFGYLYTLPIFDWMTPQDGRFTGSYIVWAVVGMLWLAVLIQNYRKKAKIWSDHLAIAPFLLATVYRILYFYISGYVHMRSWYWTVESFFVFLMLAGLVSKVDFKNFPLRKYSAGILAIILVCVGLQSYEWITLIHKVYPYNEAARTNQDYLGVARLLEESTPPGAVIGTPGGGSLSYFIQNRTIVNLDGLMNSKEYFDALKLFDTHALMQRSNIQYILSNDYTITSSLPYSAIFNHCISPIKQIYGKYLYEYRCK